LSGPALRRVGKLTLRLAITYALLYAAWLPIQGGYVRLLSDSASRVLSLTENPPIITGLSPSGNTIKLESYVSGRRAPIASWNAENIHIFVVASLALVLSFPAGGWRRMAVRVFGSVLVVFLYTLTLTVVQLRTVAGGYAAGHQGLNLYTPSQVAFLDWANRGLIMVGMLLLPTFLFLTSYMSSWARERWTAPATRTSPETHRPGKVQKPPREWKALALVAAAGAALLAFLLTPPQDATFEEVREGLERIVALNPGSPDAYFALGLFLEDGKRPSEALASYEMALRLNPQMIAPRFNQGNIHSVRGDFAEAVRCYQEVIRLNPRHVSALNNLGFALFKQGLYDQAAEAYGQALEIDERHASTHKNLGETLLLLERRCEALVHLQRSAELDYGFSADRRLQARIERLKGECGESREIVPAAVRAKN